MFDLLKEFTALHHQIYLPGIGKIALEKSPARADFSDKMFYPPKDEWKFFEGSYSNDDSLIYFISGKKNISIAGAMEVLENFCSSIKSAIKNSEEIKIPGIGILKKDSSGSLQLETVIRDTLLLKPVIAERVIRKDSEHTILVGDTEKTNFQMNELLHSGELAVNAKWWAWAGALFVFTAGLIAYNFSQNNWRASALGNQHIISPAPLPVHVSEMVK
jgi:Bacterial DNA-binding protein